MRPHSFVLSWGRKMFFGLGWPLLCLVALSYLKSQIVPTSALGIFYYLVTLIGHCGLITALLYFVLYWPLARLFPNYYFSRFWSMTLILTTGLLIFVDSIVFTQYRFHFNKFIWNLAIDGGVADIFHLRPSFYIIATTLMLAALAYMWYRGEKLWRSMQRRFSNPNGNWYLILIALFVLISHGMHVYGDAYGKRSITRYGSILPLYFPATAKGLLGDAGVLPDKVQIQDFTNRDFMYPSEQLVCPGTENKNILLITVDRWTPAYFNEHETPLLWHYKHHGINFQHHLSASISPDISLFSLFYALPGNFIKLAKQDQVSPVVMDELGKRGYGFGLFSDHELDREFILSTIFLRAPEVTVNENVNEAWRNWLETHLSGEEKPFFGYLSLGSEVGIDAKISEVVEGLHVKGLTQKTIVIIVGTNGQSIPHELRVPLLILWPDKPSENILTKTSHYDIFPTVMKEEWLCENSFETFSDGRSLFEEKNRDWYLIGDAHQHEIIDFLKQQLIIVNPFKGYEVKDFSLHDLPRQSASKELMLSILRNETRFSKKVKF